MIQDIFPYVYRNEYKPQKPCGENYVMYFEDGRAIGKTEENKVRFLKFREVEADNPNIYEEAVYLFSIDDMKFYLAEHLQYSVEHIWIAREEFRVVKPVHFAFAGITAYQLHRWYESHKFCGKCGSKMKRDDKERMVFCEKCHQMEYPRICPAVIVGVTDGNRLLLTKYAGRQHKKYALVAGFAEIGESIEDTVRREVMEEVGLKVKSITYYKSQPWSFTDTLLFGFFAEVDGSSEIVMDKNELSVAEWFEREEIPVTEISVSLTNEMILYFKYGKNMNESRKEQH